MRSRYIPATVTLTAATITCIICIVKSYDTLYSLKVLIAVLICFYVLGIIAKHIIVKVTSERKPKEETVDTEDTTEEEEQDFEDKEENTL